MEIREPAVFRQSQSVEAASSTELSRLKEAAIKLEASFLAEMLKSSGMAIPPDAFGGGPGEEQFASFLVREHADQLARAGGIGLSESIFDALKRYSDGQKAD